MAQMSGGPFTYHFSDGAATVIGHHGSGSYLFSSGTATVYGRGEFGLSSGDATVFAYDGTNSYYLGDGDYALHGAGFKDEFIFTSSSQLANGATLMDGGDGSTDALYLGGQNQVYDLTAPGRASIQNVERIFVETSNLLKVDDASLVGVTTLADGVVTTAAASLDLSGKFISASIYSDNASGTAFTVTDADAAFQIVGGTGSDAIVGSGFTFTAAQRTGIFLNSSVETITDDSGTYTAPYQLTIGDDILPASASDTEVVATSLTLNSGDQLDGGDGHDVLALFGGGTFHLDEVSQFDGFEEVQLKYVNGSGPSEVYLRNGADVYVSGEGSGGGALYFGSGAATSVSMAQMSGGPFTYHFSDGAATVIGHHGSGSYLFSSGTATVYGRGEFGLSSGDATVFAYDGTNSYYLGDGDYALHGAGFKDEFIFTSSSQLANGATLMDGGDGSTDALYLGGQNQVYDLTAPGRASIQNVERIFVETSNLLKVDDASLVGVTTLADGVVTTAAASLDLSGKFISASIYSDNASGTAFTVTDADAAFQIVGGTGSDAIVGSGFTFTAAQRTGIFLNSSVETITDDSGTYTAPYQLTIGDDILPASASDTEVVATSLTLNSGDQLDGGDGHDVLALFGGGTFHLDEVSQFDGFEEVQLKYVNGSGPSEVYLRNGADVYVSGEGSGGGALYFGSGAATSVSMAQMSGGPFTYHFSDGAATVIGHHGSGSYLFSSGTATVYGRGEFGLSSGDVTVFAYDGTNSYYLGDGDYALHGAGFKDEFIFTSSSQLANGATLMDGGDGSTDALYLGGQNQVYDLTAPGRASIQNVERIFVETSNLLKVDDASLVGVTTLADGVVTTAAASLDLSGKFISASIYSDNASGTAFTVTDAGAAFQIVGGTGSDAIVGSGFTFTAAQRTGIFLNSSVETITDDSGTYGNDENNTIVTLNPNDLWIV